MGEYNLHIQETPGIWTCFDGHRAKIDKCGPDGKHILVWDGESADIGAEIERLREELELKQS